MQAARRLGAAFFRAAAILLCLAAIPANAAIASRCIAMARATPGVQFVALQTAQATKEQVRITFVGHSTFRIESSGGLTIATDYAGYAGSGPMPDIVTMNQAHSTHYTDYPDPAIKHVLRGWNPAGGPAQHNLTLGDVYVRNVPTDIRRWGSALREKDGNSIFIFEVGGMCIGHLGHLHHELGPEHLGLIGQLDIVMVPVDGTFTMAQGNMVEVVRLLKARLVLPMHVFGPSTLASFLARMGQAFEVEVGKTSTVVVSEATLPPQTKVLVLQGASYFGAD